MRVAAAALLGILTACGHMQNDAAAPNCPAGNVCAVSMSGDNKLYLGVMNNTERDIFLPWMHAVSDVEYQFSVNPVSYQRDVQKGFGSPIDVHPGTVLLPPGGWLGVSVNNNDLQEIFELQSGCQTLEIGYRVRPTLRDESLYKGAVLTSQFRACIED